MVDLSLPRLSSSLHASVCILNHEGPWPELCFSFSIDFEGTGGAFFELLHGDIEDLSDSFIFYFLLSLSLTSWTSLTVFHISKTRR